MKRLAVLLALMSILMAGIAYGVTCTFDQATTTAGTSSTYLRGTNVNISVTMSDWVNDGDNATNATLTVAGGTLGGTTTNEGSEGDNATYLNVTVDTTGLNDTATYTFTMTIYNETANSIGTCTRTFITDNTLPVCTYATGLVGNDEYLPTQLWQTTCQNTSSAKIQFGNNAPLTMAYLDDTCKYTGSASTVPESNYAFVRTRHFDGLNYTNCDLSYVKIDAGAPLKEVAAIAASSAGAKRAAGTGTNPVVIVAILGLAGFAYVKYGKKGK